MNTFPWLGEMAAHSRRGQLKVIKEPKGAPGAPGGLCFPHFYDTHLGGGLAQDGCSDLCHKMNDFSVPGVVASGQVKPLDLQLRGLAEPWQ